MREKHVEQKLNQAVHNKGGMSIKITSPGLNGMPDRLIILPGGKTAFIEVKAPGQKPRPIQTHRHQQLINLGIPVHIINHPQAALLLEMGLGKTIITLTAINQLIYDHFDVTKALIIAPLRVARDTWPEEIEKWDHLKNLRVSVMVSPQTTRQKALHTEADIYIINRENLPWLANQTTKHWPFDMVVIDELSSFKNHKAQRFKALVKKLPNIHRIVGLTGTPAPNSLLDLWAQFRLIDGGQRLGRLITYYRDNYFKPDKRNGMHIYTWKLRPEAENAI